MKLAKCLSTQLSMSLNIHLFQFQHHLIDEKATQKKDNHDNFVKLDVCYRLATQSRDST